jgi:hypothetical protein
MHFSPSGRNRRIRSVSVGPALTRSLKHLGEVLGLPLFDRQGVTPTVSGELMLNHGEGAIKGFAKNPELETEAVRSSKLNLFCAAKHPLAGPTA